MSDKATGVCGIVGIIFVVLGGIAVFGLWMDQCQLGHGDSLNIQVDQVTLLSPPTDNVFLGWESLFGKPADEISVNIHSAVLCGHATKAQEIFEGETLRFGESLSINSFFNYGVSFWLEESDGGFEGADDLSQVVEIPRSQMDSMRTTLDSGAADYIQLNYSVVVEGRNIFQENSWFGFLAENLCVSALDFVFGPWTGKAVGKAVLFNAGDMAKLYNAVKLEHKVGTLTKKSLMKSVVTYQFRVGAKKAVVKPFQRNVIAMLKEWAMNQTMLDEEITNTVNYLKEQEVYTDNDQLDKGLDIYRTVNDELGKLAGYLDSLTDSLEFCLAEILPPSEDALYYLSMTVRR
ncbi:uncharacterized protein LOC119742005 [Patiria miniata]|uniref:Uncharacterized protein n=1 Tax=Patiria miniata TaxID=46514 RepID=A0A914BET0_PATMI|nr:uncharacterized protein LOC119742005 [Patiria miniata]XP_038073928.1 uncharacterized protein LOC119742005 [Patiria miniata]